MKKLKNYDLYFFNDQKKANNPDRFDATNLGYFGHIPLISSPQTKIDNLLKNIVE